MPPGRPSLLCRIHSEGFGVPRELPIWLLPSCQSSSRRRRRRPPSGPRPIPPILPSTSHYRQSGTEHLVSRGTGKTGARKLGQFGQFQCRVENEATRFRGSECFGSGRERDERKQCEGQGSEMIDQLTTLSPPCRGIEKRNPPEEKILKLKRKDLKFSFAKRQERPPAAALLRKMPGHCCRPWVCARNRCKTRCM